jgi:HSP20 family protein
MNETQTNQPEGQANYQASSNGDGAREDQGRASGSQRRGGSMTTQGSTGRGGRMARGQGSQGLSQIPSRLQNPFAMMRQMSREMDRMMDSFFERGLGSLSRDTGAEGWQSRPFWTPRLDVQQRNDAVVVRADLPGARKEDVQIEVEGDTLVISGERRAEHEEGGEGQGYQLVERSYGSFYRTVPLPQGTNPEQIKAEMRDGVLTITLPLSEDARPRRIQIQG